MIKKQRSHDHGNGELLAALARGLALTAGSTADNERDFAFNTKNYVKKSIVAFSRTCGEVARTAVE